VPGVQEVELSTPLSALQDQAGISGKRRHLDGDDFENEVYDLLPAQGRQMAGRKYLGIERMHAPFYGVDIGDCVIFEVGKHEQTFEIRGKIRHPFVPPPNMYDYAFFFGGEEVMEEYGIPPGQFNQLTFQVDNYSPERARKAASAVKERLPSRALGCKFNPVPGPEEHWGRVFVDGMSVVTQVLSVVSLLLSAVLVSNTLMAIITQQTNQLGISKPSAVPASP
jgi:putative ABC transport system permease protein